MWRLLKVADSIEDLILRKRELLMKEDNTEPAIELKNLEESDQSIGENHPIQIPLISPTRNERKSLDTLDQNLSIVSQI